MERQQKIVNIVKNILLPVLPESYNFDDIYKLLEEYYPFDLQEFEEMLEIYRHKEKTLYRRQGRVRNDISTVSEYIKAACRKKNILSSDGFTKRKINYDDEKRKSALQNLEKKRKIKVESKFRKIKQAKILAQSVEPDFLDALLGTYQRKGTTQLDRMYILQELRNYDCDKVIDFLHRNLEHEQNFQLRELSLKHLHEYGHFGVLRRKNAIPILTKNKKKRKKIKEYRNIRTTITANPEILHSRIINKRDKKITTFKYFISHSYQDGAAVQNIIDTLNQLGSYVYCDWMSDHGFLKRILLCRATVEVIKKRLEQSEGVLFVDSANARKSKWVAYELQYAQKIGKPIFVTDIQSMKDGITIKRLDEKWYEKVDTSNIYADLKE